MATITYPAMDLGAPKRAPKRNARRRNSSSPPNAAAAALAGIGVMALAGAAATTWKRPVLAIGGLVLGALTASLIYERGTVTR